MGRASRGKAVKRLQRWASEKRFHTNNLIGLLQGASGMPEDKLRELKVYVLQRLVSTVDHLRACKPGIERAQVMRLAVDTFLEAEGSNRNRQRVTCKAGCSHCCHINASATEDEAETIAQAMADGLEVDLALLERQAAYPDDCDFWWKASKVDTRCSFLKDGLCSIYAIRPAACRLHMSIDDPAKCDKDNGRQDHLKFSCLNAEITLSAAMNVSKTGPIPKMVWAAIQRRKG